MSAAAASIQQSNTIVSNLVKSLADSEQSDSGTTNLTPKVKEDLAKVETSILLLSEHSDSNALRECHALVENLANLEKKLAKEESKPTANRGSGDGIDVDRNEDASPFREEVGRLHEAATQQLHTRLADAQLSTEDLEDNVVIQLDSSRKTRVGEDDIVQISGESFRPAGAKPKGLIKGSLGNVGERNSVHLDAQFALIFDADKDGVLSTQETKELVAALKTTQGFNSIDYALGTTGATISSQKTERNLGDSHGEVSKRNSLGISPEGSSGANVNAEKSVNTTQGDITKNRSIKLGAGGTIQGALRGSIGFESKRSDSNGSLSSNSSLSYTKKDDSQGIVASTKLTNTGKGSGVNTDFAAKIGAYKAEHFEGFETQAKVSLAIRSESGKPFLTTTIEGRFVQAQKNSQSLRGAQMSASVSGTIGEKDQTNLSIKAKSELRSSWLQGSLSPKQAAEKYLANPSELPDGITFSMSVEGDLKFGKDGLPLMKVFGQEIALSELSVAYSITPPKGDVTQLHKLGGALEFKAGGTAIFVGGGVQNQGQTGKMNPSISTTKATLGNGKATFFIGTKIDLDKLF